MSRLGSSQTGRRAIFSKIDRTGHSHDTLALEKLPRATGDRGQSSCQPVRHSSEPYRNLTSMRPGH